MEGRTSSTDQARARPGWYADPHEDGRLRKWDGERWTDLWMAAPGVSAGATTVGAHPVSAAGWYDDPYAGDDVARQRFWDGEVWTHRLRHGRTFRGRPPLAGWFVGVAWALRAALLLNGLGAAAGLGMAIWTL